MITRLFNVLVLLCEELENMFFNHTRNEQCGCTKGVHMYYQRGGGVFLLLPTINPLQVIGSKSCDSFPKIFHISMRVGHGFDHS